MSEFNWSLVIKHNHWIEISALTVSLNNELNIFAEHSIFINKELHIIHILEKWK